VIRRLGTKLTLTDAVRHIFYIVTVITVHLYVILNDIKLNRTRECSPSGTSGCVALWYKPEGHGF
jgi:hypothetical protein